MKFFTVFTTHFLMFYVIPIQALEQSTDNHAAQKLSYQSAAIYSNLNWLPAKETAIKINLSPIINFSGVPIEYREEDSDYFDHGKIPLSIEPLFSGLLNASHYFVTNEIDADYRMQISINRYQMPYNYAPDDNWWRTISANNDRRSFTAKSAIVLLSLKLSSKKLKMPDWSSSVQTSLTFCDLNAQTQALNAFFIDPVITEYTQSPSGQAFIAASNFLILQAIQHINQTRGLAQIVIKKGNELLLVSDNYSFTIGESLGIYYRDKGNNHTGLPAGRVQIVKTYNNQAVAYPLTMRADQIVVGDWVELSSVQPFIDPSSNFSPKNQCNQTPITELGF